MSAVKTEVCESECAHSVVRFERDTVIKTAPAVLMGVQVEKTRRAFDIGRNCGLFRVPKVLDYDETKGQAVFEKLTIAPVATAVPWGWQKIRVAKSLGASLAVIHRELVLPEKMRVGLPSRLASPEDEVFLHGDLSTYNVCVERALPRLVILDWQMTPAYGGRATYGTRYFDIIWFIHNLINRPQTRFLFGNPVAPVISAFLEAYFSETALFYDSEKLATYATRFFEVEMPRMEAEIIRNSRGRSRLLLPRSRVILRAFMKSL